MANGVIQYARELINDSQIATKTTYSSDKIEKLIADGKVKVTSTPVAATTTTPAYTKIDIVVGTGATATTTTFNIPSKYVIGAHVATDGKLILEMSDGTTINLGKIGSGSSAVYQSTKTLINKVNQQTILTTADLVETVTLANDIDLNQLVYDAKGTIARVTSIDLANNQFVVTTMTLEDEYMSQAPNTKEFRIINGGSNYQVGDVIESTTTGIFADITGVDVNGSITSVTLSTATAQSVSGTGATIDYDQIVYGAYGNTWTALSNAAVLVAQIITEQFEYIDGYKIEITGAGTGYSVNDIVEVSSGVFARVLTVGTSGEILTLEYSRETVQNTSGTGATFNVTTDPNTFIIPSIYWNSTSDIFNLVNDDGASVLFNRSGDVTTKYSAGPDGKTYKFEYNQYNGTITQSYKISGGGLSTISSKPGNAATNITGSTNPAEDGLYVKDLEAKLNQISSIQRVNIGNAPEYMLIYTRAGGTPSSRAVSQGTYNVTSWHNDLETNMDSSRYDVTSANGYVILKKGITYELEFSTLSDSLGASYYIRNEAGQNIGNRGYMSANIGKWTDESIKGIYTPKKDEKITFEVTYQTQFFAAELGTTTLSTTGLYYMDCSHIFIRQINPYVVDPVEHVNIDKGLEDTPVGHIMSTAGGTTPPHYLPCNGAEYNIADYPYLSEYFKTELGSYNCFGGDGITTFAVPNIKNTEKLDTTSISGNAWASSIYSSNYLAAKAFNGIIDVNNNYWQTVASPTFPVEIGIDLENGYVVKKYVLHNYGWSAGAIDDRPTSWTFEGSINKTDWDILDTQTNYTWTTGKEEFNIANVRPYRYYRFIITATIGGQKSPILNQVELFVNTENPSHIKYEPTYFFNVEGDVTYEYGCETILGCFDTAPAITAINDMYYNTTDGRIYTSVDGVSWDTGTYPQKDILYISMDDHKIYSYTNNTFEVYGGGMIDISSKANNAIKNITGSTVASENGLYVEDLSNKVNALNIAQKTVNSELEYYYATKTTSISGVSIKDSNLINYLPYLTNITSNLEPSRYNTKGVTLKKSKTYKITFGLARATTSGNGTSSYIMDSDGNKLGNRGYFGSISYSDNIIDVIYTPTKDISVYPALVNLNTNLGSTYYPDCSFFQITEVGREVTIDPVEYVNTTQGIEDTPVGEIIKRLGSKAPKHYLPCDGTEYNIIDYPYLTQYFKDEFGSVNYFGGDGVTTFKVPDLSEPSKLTKISPIMTSDTTPSPYKVTRSSVWSSPSDHAWRVFDGVKTGSEDYTWISAANELHPWICVDLGTKTKMTSFKLWLDTGKNKFPEDFTLQGSNDGTNFTNIKSFTNVSSMTQASDGEIEFNLDRVAEYRYYKIYVDTLQITGGATYIRIYEWEMYFKETKSNSYIKYEPTYFMKYYAGISSGEMYDEYILRTGSTETFKEFCQDIKQFENRPDLWEAGKEYNFGSGLYGLRTKGNFSGNLLEVIPASAKATNIISWGGSITNTNGNRWAVPGAMSAYYYEIYREGTSVNNPYNLQYSGDGSNPTDADIWVKYVKN